MAAMMLEKDKEEKKKEREAALNERVPPLQMSGLSVQDLQVCGGQKLHGSSGQRSFKDGICYVNKLFYLKIHLFYKSEHEIQPLLFFHIKIRLLILFFYPSAGFVQRAAPQDRCGRWRTLRHRVESGEKQQGGQMASLTLSVCVCVSAHKHLNVTFFPCSLKACRRRSLS